MGMKLGICHENEKTAKKKILIEYMLKHLKVSIKPQGRLINSILKSTNFPNLVIPMSALVLNFSCFFFRDINGTSTDIGSVSVCV